jgi:hypothetical protein
MRQDRCAMYRRLAFLALPLLLAHAPIDDALAGHGNSSQSRSAYSGPRHAISSRHHARGVDGTEGTYHSQRLRAKSEWRQAQHRRNTPAPVQTATQ